MKNTAMAMLAGLLMTACSIQPVPFTGPNGGVAYSMKCSGGMLSMDKCYQKAGELCSRGYRIIDSSSTTRVFGVNGAIGSARDERLAIECK